MPRRLRQVHSKAPALTAFIEDERIRRRMTKKQMSEILGINDLTYTRNVSIGNENGLTEVELKKAYTFFGYRLVAVPNNILFDERHDVL
jgi:hypothetical protein